MGRAGPGRQLLRHHQREWGDYLNDRDIDHGAATGGLTDAQARSRRRRRPETPRGRGGGVAPAPVAWRGATRVAMQVEVDAQTGEVVNPLQYMPDADRIFPRGNPNYLPASPRDGRLRVAEHEAWPGRLIDEELNVTMGWYNHMDEEA